MKTETNSEKLNRVINTPKQNPLPPCPHIDSIKIILPKRRIRLERSW
jgi:hypothetical protein